MGSGNCDHCEAGGSRQEVRDRTGKLCGIKGARRQREGSGLRYIYLHSVSPKCLPQHPILKRLQPVPLNTKEFGIFFILYFVKQMVKCLWEFQSALNFS